MVDPTLLYRRYHGYVSSLICLTGIVGNVVSCIVWIRKKSQKPTFFILSFLAIADALCLLMFQIYVVCFFMMMSPNDEETYTKAGMYIVMISFHLFIAFHMLSTWFTITMMIFRYIKIVKPTLASKVCTITRAKISIAVVTVMVLLASAANYPFYEVQKINQGNATNATIYFLMPTAFTKSHPEYPTLLLWIYGVVVKIIPIMTIVILCGLIICHIQNAKRRVQDISQSLTSAETYNQTSLMLTVIAFIYVLTELPIGIMSFISGFHGDDGHLFYFLLFSGVGDLLDLCTLVNSTVNVFVYICMSGEFRRIFLKMIKCN
ncbi:G-protein coupled receptor dmsr-1-like [Saccostrea echinata]|uniref:G-protein coupled receptor dmsr-1-like n=1 Tax=Saccostrea echinata TaxID=191078 RepID=UPI002A7F69A1|nr:G-protein coupled receptor dmsr-1-like [Saccostrea echinata]